MNLPLLLKYLFKVIAYLGTYLSCLAFIEANIFGSSQLTSAQSDDAHSLDRDQHVDTIWILPPPNKKKKRKEKEYWRFKKLEGAEKRENNLNDKVDIWLITETEY